MADNKKKGFGLGEFLSGLAGLGKGITDSIGNVGKSVYGLFGTGAAAAMDLLEGDEAKRGYNEGKHVDAFKRSLYGTDSKGQINYGKAAGEALDAATTLTNFIPGGGKLAANVAQGAVSGLANEYKEKGNDADLGNALKSAATGAMTGAATSKMNDFVGKKMGILAEKQANNTISNFGQKALNASKSNFVRGAISGATGGAVGGGMATALEGGSLGDVIGNAMSTASSGALQGGISGSVNSKLKQIGQNIRDDIWAGKPSKDFGKAYTQFSGKPEEAIDYLMYRKKGEVPAALQSSTVGNITGDDNIDLVYGKGGKEGFGLAHILEKHGTGAVKNVANIIQNGTVVDDPRYTNGRRITLTNNDNTGAVRLDWSDKKKQWVVSSFEGLPTELQKQKTSAPNTTLGNSAITGDSFGGDTSGAPSNLTLPQNGQNINSTFDQNLEPIQNKNKLQQFGKQLQNTANIQKYRGLYDSLDTKTAKRAVATNAPKTLSDLGVNPQDYAEYAKTSSYVNKTVSDLAKKSGVKTNLPNLVDDLSLDNSDLLLSDTAAKKYNSYISKIVADGSNPSEYSASYLLEKSRELGNKAANLRGNTDDVSMLKQALTDAKYTLRDAATKALTNSYVTGDDTNAMIAQGLKQLGANQKVQDYYAEAVNGEAPTVADYIRRSALFEQARDMGNQMEAEKYTRSASKAPKNWGTRLYESTGLDKPIETTLNGTISPIAAKATGLAGRLIEGLGNLRAGTQNNQPQSIPIPQTPQSQENSTNWKKTPDLTSLILGRKALPQTALNMIGRGVGNENAYKVQDTLQHPELDEDESQATQQQYMQGYGYNQGSYGNSQASYGAGQSNGSNIQNMQNATLGSVIGDNAAQNTAMNMIGRMPQGSSDNPITGQLANIGNAMQLALNAGDITSYAKLAGIYSNILDVYKTQEAIFNPQTKPTKLTDSQKKANAAMDLLNNLEGQEANFNSAVADIPIIGGIMNLGGNEYKNSAEALESALGYLQSGAQISEKERESIRRAYIPQWGESDAVKKRKLAAARQVIQNFAKANTEG